MKLNNMRTEANTCKQDSTKLKLILNSCLSNLESTKTYSNYYFFLMHVVVCTVFFNISWLARWRDPQGRKALLVLITTVNTEYYRLFVLFQLWQTLKTVFLIEAPCLVSIWRCFCFQFHGSRVTMCFQTNLFLF